MLLWQMKMNSALTDLIILLREPLSASLSLSLSPVSFFGTLPLRTLHSPSTLTRVRVFTYYMSVLTYMTIPLFHDNMCCMLFFLSRYGSTAFSVCLGSLSRWKNETVAIQVLHFDQFGQDPQHSWLKSSSVSWQNLRCILHMVVGSHFWKIYNNNNTEYLKCPKTAVPNLFCATFNVNVFTERPLRCRG